MASLSTLSFDNSFRRLPPIFYAREEPRGLKEAHLVSLNPNAANLLGLDAAELKEQELVSYFGGDAHLPGAEPLAMVYAGHQFGVYVPRLGDGRGLLLGEVLDDTCGRTDLHLKGAGQTPYSRFGDGRAVLRSCIREYLCSEAMHALGIPTTRALCIIGSREPVRRETIETGATLLRLAKSHVRFGHFEYFHYQGQEDAVRQLADYVLRRHMPESVDEADRYALLFERAVRLTAETIGLWQARGFAHGVMNTDNMSIIGETLDYGPFGFLDDYEPGFICNHSDSHGRYAFDRQPSIGLWNCAALAQSLCNLVPEEALKENLSRYEGILQESYLKQMRASFGLEQAEEDDLHLVGELLQLMHRQRADYHATLRGLADFELAPPHGPLADAFSDRQAFSAWAARYARRLQAEGQDAAKRRQAIQAANPAYVLRNCLAHNAIQRATGEGNYSELSRLLALVQEPFRERDGMEEYAAPPPEWGKHLEVSCSS